MGNSMYWRAIDWINARSTKIRRTGPVRGGRPSTAELRRYLHDRATPRHVKNHIYQFLLYRRHALSVVMFVVLAALAILEAATRPFVLTADMTSVHCIERRCFYVIGGGALTVSTSDPVMKAHLETYLHKTITLVVED